ncbi:MAG: hypothetical protein U0531_14050 [Dehalococcoidia bacterium]
MPCRCGTGTTAPPFASSPSAARSSIATPSAPGAPLCIDERDGSLRYVTAEGPVTVQDSVSYEERLALHTHYRGPERAKEIVDRGGHERMVLLVLTPERWLG